MNNSNHVAIFKLKREIKGIERNKYFALPFMKGEEINEATITKRSQEILEGLKVQLKELQKNTDNIIH